MPVVMEPGKNLPSILVEKFSQLNEISRLIKPKEADASQSRDTNINLNESIQPIRTPETISSLYTWSISGPEMTTTSHVSDTHSQSEESLRPIRSLAYTKKSSGEIEIKHYPPNMPQVLLDILIQHVEKEIKPELEEIQPELEEHEPERERSQQELELDITEMSKHHDVLESDSDSDNYMESEDHDIDDLDPVYIIQVTEDQYGMMGTSGNVGIHQILHQQDVTVLF